MNRSGALTNGIAAVALPFATVGLPPRTAYQGITWLSEEAQRDAEHLEQKLNTPPGTVTTAEARGEFERQFNTVATQARESANLGVHSEAVARIAALRTSVIGQEVTPAEWTFLAAQRFGSVVVSEVLERASNRFTKSTTVLVRRAIIAAATAIGFTHHKYDHYGEHKRTLFLVNDRGHGLTADLVDSNEGTRVYLYVTGLGDPARHLVIDSLLSELERRKVHLRDAQEK